ncbi:MAG: hypothetical protein AAGU21_10255 [Solidesulfovibrio sp.]|uniref:hypothetical protein n=1 Tax=Solidesulfovibrio sp. TaxID=2910990 RepID=UPI0031595AE0
MRIFILCIMAMLAVKTNLYAYDFDPDFGKNGYINTLDHFLFGLDESGESIEFYTINSGSNNATSITKYTSSGDINQNFGNSGSLVFNELVNAKVKDNQKIFIHKKSSDNFCQMLPDGPDDPSFNNGECLPANSFSPVLPEFFTYTYNNVLIYKESGNCTLTIKKILDDGKTDASFGNNGVLNLTFPGCSDLTQGNNDWSKKIEIDANNNILISAGFFSTSSAYLCKTFRFTGSGSLDTTFGPENNGAINYCSRSIHSNDDGTFFIRSNGESQNSILMKFDKKGLIDTSFAENGIIEGMRCFLFGDYVPSPDGFFVINAYDLQLIKPTYMYGLEKLSFSGKTLDIVSANTINGRPKISKKGVIYMSGVTVSAPASTDPTYGDNLIYRLSPSKSSALSDADNDGVIDDWDQCPNTPANTPVNKHGCPERRAVVIPLGSN